MTTLDLNQLRDEANAWLLAQPADYALCPCQVAHFRERFCLPQWLVEAIDREREKSA